MARHPPPATRRPPPATRHARLATPQVLAPVLDLFVDARFGRLQEGFGEEPALVAAFARAAAIGLQGDPAHVSPPLARSYAGGATSSSPAARDLPADGPSDSHSRPSAASAAQAADAANAVRATAGARRVLAAGRVLAVAKHFLGYGAAEGGLNGGMVRQPPRQSRRQSRRQPRGQPRGQ